MGQRRNENTLRWWNNKYASADAHQAWSSQKRLRFYAMIATAIPKKPATILDVGSGLGFGPAYLTNIFQDWHVESLDFSDKACDKAVIKTHCVNIIIDNIPGSYDYVIAAETLEHFSEPMTILDKMYQAARKAVILTVPYEGVISSVHVSSFGKHTFDKYPNVRVELSPGNHFMLAIITKPETIED